MSKRPSPSKRDVQPIQAEPVTPAQPAPYHRSAQPLSLSLDDIRRAASRERANVVQTILDLEAWRAEIDATIAFLKSNEK